MWHVSLRHVAKLFLRVGIEAVTLGNGNLSVRSLLSSRATSSSTGLLGILSVRVAGGVADYA